MNDSRECLDCGHDRGRYLGCVAALVLAFLLAVPTSARSSVIQPTGGVTNIYAPHSLTLADGVAYDRFLGRNFGAPVSSGAVTVVERYGLSVGGGAIEVAAQRSIAWPAVAAAVAAVGAAAYVGVQAAAPINVMLGHTDVTLGNVRCVALMSGWQCDDGAPAPVVTQYRAGSENPVGYGYTPLLACQALAELRNSSSPACSAFASKVTITATGASGGICSGTKTIQGAGTCVTSAPAAWSDFYSAAGSGPGPCPAVTDALNPAYSRPEGSPPGADGKCPTGRYSSKTPEDVAAVIEAGAADRTKAPAVVEDLLTRGLPISGAGPRSLSGPSSSPGVPTSSTSTNPDGSTVTTTNTPTVQYTYAGDTINYTETNVTTTESCTAQGSCNTTTTTTTDVPQPDEACKANPLLIGCQELGDPGEPSVPKHTDTLSFAAEPVSLAAACPAPVSLGSGRVISYQAFCDVATTIAPATVVIAAFAAALLMLAALRGGS